LAVHHASYGRVYASIAALRFLPMRVVPVTSTPIAVRSSAPDVVLARMVAIKAPAILRRLKQPRRSKTRSERACSA
jgi:hypothetical protein